MLEPLTWFSAKVGTPLVCVGWVMEMEAEALLLLSAMDVAVSVTVGVVGAVAGAVYVTDVCV